VVIRPIFRRRIWSLLASARPRRGIGTDVRAT